MTITSSDFQEFREHQRRAYRLAWIAIVAGSLAGFFALGVPWSYLAGLVWAVVFPLVSYEGLKQWNRCCWLSRFPELAATDVKWIPESAGPAASNPHDVMKPRRTDANR